MGKGVSVMRKEEYYAQLSLLSYYDCPRLDISVAAWIRQLLADPHLRQESERREDRRRNLAAVAGIPQEAYEDVWVRAFHDDNHVSGVVYYIFEAADVQIFAFRGSEALDDLHHTTGWQDWMDNFQMFLDGPTPQQLYALHRLHLETLVRPYVLCGHSKGGNLALYCALCMEDTLRDKLDSVYAYNAPGITRSILDVYASRIDAPFLEKLHILENENDCISAFFEHVKAPLYIRSALPCTSVQELYHNHNLYALDLTEELPSAKGKSAVPRIVHHLVNDFFMQQKKIRRERVVMRMADYFRSDLSMEELYKVFLYHISRYTILFEDIPYEDIKNITFQELLERRKRLLPKSKAMLQHMGTTWAQKRKVLNETDVQEVLQSIAESYELLRQEAFKNVQETIMMQRQRIWKAFGSLLDRNKQEDLPNE